MPRELQSDKKARAQEIERRLYEHIGTPSPFLDFTSPFTLAVAVVLSAQSTDAAVNKVTPILFERFPTAADLADAPLEVIEEIIHPLGFFRNKAKNIKALARVCATQYEGSVPDSLVELQKLPGIGRKTANCVMCVAFNKAEGIAVDTHVFRISHRLKLCAASANTPEKVEQALLRLFPQEEWIRINHQFVWFGRTYCKARKPLCNECFLADLCPSAPIA